MLSDYVDLLVGTNNPEYLDSVAQQISCGALQGGPENYHQIDGCYRLRLFGTKDPSFAIFAIKNQGYGTVVRTESVVDNLIDKF